MDVCTLFCRPHSPRTKRVIIISANKKGTLWRHCLSQAPATPLQLVPSLLDQILKIELDANS